MNEIKEVLEESGIKQKWLAEKLGNIQKLRLEILFEIAEIL